MLRKWMLAGGLGLLFAGAGFAGTSESTVEYVYVRASDGALLIKLQGVTLPFLLQPSAAASGAMAALAYGAMADGSYVTINWTAHNIYDSWLDSITRH